MLMALYWDDRLMLEDNQKPHKVAIGDSWFWYTLTLCQIALQAMRP
jgi:hypothetical protein